MSTLTRVDSVTYDTPGGGTMTVRYDAPEWVVDDNGTEHRFPNVRAWTRYARETHTWPLPVRSS